VYALIMLALAPFILLGAVMGLFWLEERMLPSAERSLAAAMMQSVPQFPTPDSTGLPAMAGHDMSGYSLPDPAESMGLSTAAARSAADDRLVSHPAISGPARLAHGRSEAPRTRSGGRLGSRRRPPEPARNVHRDHR
jgi:hypothetical protein